MEGKTGLIRLVRAAFKAVRAPASLVQPGYPWQRWPCYLWQRWHWVKKMAFDGQIRLCETRPYTKNVLEPNAWRRVWCCVPAPFRRGFSAWHWMTDKTHTQPIKFSSLSGTYSSMNCRVMNAQSKLADGLPVPQRNLSDRKRGKLSQLNLSCGNGCPRLTVSSNSFSFRLRRSVPNRYQIGIPVHEMIFFKFFRSLRSIGTDFRNPPWRSCYASSGETLLPLDLHALERLSLERLSWNVFSYLIQSECNNFPWHLLRSGK